MSALRNNRIAMPLCALLLMLGFAVPVLAYPADPDNAALLYYQAFLSCPKVDEPVDTQLRDFADGKIALNKVGDKQPHPNDKNRSGSDLCNPAPHNNI